MSNAYIGFYMAHIWLTTAASGTQILSKTTLFFQLAYIFPYVKRELGHMSHHRLIAFNFLKRLHIWVWCSMRLPLCFPNQSSWPSIWSICLPSPSSHHTYTRCSIVPNALFKHCCILHNIWWLKTCKKHWLIIIHIVHAIPFMEVNIT